MIISITGTPGTGKTTLANKLGKKLNYELIDVNEFIEANLNKVLIEYDALRNTKIINEKKLIKLLEKHIKTNKITNCVIDSHLSHYLSNKIIDICIVLECNISELKARLIARKYNELKIKENIEAEIFQEIKHEAEEIHSNILYIDTSKKCNTNEIIKKIINIEVSA